MSACAIAGCGNWSGQILGVPPSLQQSTLVADEAVQDAMVGSLVRRAGLEFTPRAGSPEWRYVAEAGLLEVDIQCDRYLGALFTFNREQRGARQVLTAAGAGTAAILGITGAAGATIALTAAAFGLAASVFDAGVNSVLFTISPAAVRAVAAKGRQAYLSGIRWDQINSRPRMMAVVQGYLSQCTPAAIEANIDNAATGAPSVASTDADIARKAAALGAPASAMMQDPRVFIASPVTGPSERKVDVPVDNRPRNLTPSEAAFISTKDDVRALQRALGVTADGDVGPAGLAQPGETRRAILEFHAGLQRRNNTPTPAGDIIGSASYEALRARGAMPPPFKSAFERGLFGNPADGYVSPTRTGLSLALAALGAATPDDSVEVGQWVVAMRQAVAAKRATSTNPSDVLDAALFDAGPAPVSFPRPR